MKLMRALAHAAANSHRYEPYARHTQAMLARGYAHGIGDPTDGSISTDARDSFQLLPPSRGSCNLEEWTGIRIGYD